MPTAVPRRRRLAVSLAGLLLPLALLAGTGARLAAAADKLPADLPAKYRTWLEDVALLISPAERQAFAKLEKDYQRDAFIKQFWLARDTYPETARNEYQEHWEQRIQEARQSWGNVTEDRARIYLLNGPPAGALKIDCPTLTWPAEAWFYDGSDQIPYKFIVVFYQKWGAGTYRLWLPVEGLEALLTDLGTGSNLGSTQIFSMLRNGCRNGDQVAGILSSVLNEGVNGYATLAARFEERPKPRSGEWLATFNAYSTDLPEGAPTFQASVDLSFPGRHQTRTVVQGVVGVARGEAGEADLGGHRSYNFVLTGEVLHAGELFDTFRYKFDLPAAEVGGETLPLTFERFLRPGPYTLVLKLEDLNSKKLFRTEREVEVPDLGGAGPPPAPLEPETARLLAEANAAIASGETTIKVVPPRAEPTTGMVRFDTLATGQGIDHVTFDLDGRAVLSKSRPPYSVELDLGALPRTHTLNVTAFDAEGRQLATDQLLVNAGGHRFSLHLIEPQRGKRYTQSLRAEAQIHTPEDKAVTRVEFYLNETLVATLFQPPWVQPIVLSDQPLAYVRAVAYLSDGNSTEDIVFVNAPDMVEQMSIQYVELYTTVLDPAGHPVEGLAKDDFSILEDGTRQEVSRFEQVRDLPIHAGVLLDVSASMEGRLPAVQQAALKFFQDIVTPKDRAAVITFNDRPNLTVKFTNEIATLAGGLAGLKAERGTSLYDSLVFALYYFNGIKGQRAILVLSDGKDESSRFSFDEAVEYARRAGVTIYTVGLDLPHDSARRKLSRFSEETGGRAFFVDRPDQLDEIYRAIEKELRSQYLITYQSSNTGTDGAFRAVELKVDKPGLEVKTLRGYYP